MVKNMEINKIPYQGTQISIITLKSGVCLEIVGDSELLTVIDKKGDEIFVLDKDGEIKNEKGE